MVLNLCKWVEGEEPSCSAFLSSFCLFFCGSVPDPPASWSSLDRFTGDEGRREISSLVFRALEQQCLWASLECKAIQKWHSISWGCIAVAELTPKAEECYLTIRDAFQTMHQTANFSGVWNCQNVRDYTQHAGRQLAVYSKSSHSGKWHGCPLLAFDQRVSFPFICQFNFFLYLQTLCMK